jgi:outer membrane protein assembly factor BamE
MMSINTHRMRSLIGIRPGISGLRAGISGIRPGALIVAALLACSALTGCVHRVDIQQGNFLNSEDIDRVSVGMTRVQVRALLGTPMVADPFVHSRWDYVYYLKRGRVDQARRRHFIVFFDGSDKVERIERPTEQVARLTNP